MAAATSTSADVVIYSNGEAVYCYHGPLLYEAKINDVKRSHKEGSKPTQYFVHYKGWKNTWDEWVHPERMLKINAENTALRDKLEKEQRANKPEPEKRSHKAKDSMSVPPKDLAPKDPLPPKDAKSSKREPKPKKAPKEEEGYGTEQYHWSLPQKRKADMKLVIPESLKAVLVDDWENVTRNGQLVSVPRQPCVEDIFKEFNEQHISKAGPAKRDEELGQYLWGLRAYFEEALGSNLLYRFERPQYAELLRKYAYGPEVAAEDARRNSQLYGAEHLLRLLVSLPALMTSTNMDNASINIMRENTNVLLEFLAKNKDRFFLTQYEDTSSHYLSIARA